MNKKKQAVPPVRKRAYKKRAKRAYNRKPVDTFQIIESVPQARSTRMDEQEAKKYDNTLKLLEPGKRSTILSKHERSRMTTYVKRHYPGYKMRSVKSGKGGDKFIVWRET